MVDDLLGRGVKKTSILYEFSRYTSSEKSDYSLDRILELAVDSLNVLSRSHQFLIDRHGDLPRLCCRIKDMVMMLFYLGENGLEATPEGGTITVSAKLDGNREQAIIFSVHNKGRGISPGMQGSIFQPFVSTKTSRPGLQGLGLYAARNIVQHMAGPYFLRMIPTDGTLFSARIPLPSQATSRDLSRKGEAALAEAPKEKRGR